jgi:hypothetical protein
VTGITEMYLDQASSGQVERFLQWHQAGFIDVAGMRDNQTPPQSVEQMIRGPYPIRRLRDRYGLTITAAMRCDVNGVSWCDADLLTGSASRC